MPHDESMKFMLFADEEYKSKKPFEFLDEGVVSVISPLPQDNPPPSVGKLTAIGRNITLQSIVSALSYNNSTVTRLIHIYGPSGAGKSYVAKHAAKYLFERRNFEYGCIHIELKNKYAMGENLSSLICSALGIPTVNKALLCKNYIAKCKLLIIIDKSSKVDLDRNLLNTNLEFFLEETDEPKFIVITEDKDDIMTQDKLQYEINELDPYNAARLLLL